MNIFTFEHFTLEKEILSLFNDEEINESNYNFANKATIKRIKNKFNKLSKEKKFKFFKRIAKKLKSKRTLFLFLKLFFVGALLDGLVDYLRADDPPMVDVIMATFDEYGNLKMDEIDPELVEYIEQEYSDSEYSEQDSEGVDVKKQLKNTKSSFAEAQKIVKINEGGYSDDKGDRGNYVRINGKRTLIGTKYGISASVLMDYLGRPITKSDMKNLSYETALEIYKRDYWDINNLDEFRNQAVANIIYDGCINHGTRAMKVILKKILKDKDYDHIKLGDVFDDETIAIFNLMDQEELFNDIKEGRLQRYKNSITWKRHGAGWTKRLDRFNFSS